MLKAKIQEESQARQADYITERQEAADMRTLARQQSMADQAEQRGRAGEFRGLFDQVGKASSLESLAPTQALTGAGAQLGQTDPAFAPGVGAPRILGMDTTALPDTDAPSPIHQLVAARKAKQADLLREARVTEGGRERIGPGAAKGFLGRDGMFNQTERTGAQEGSRALQTELAGPDMDPEVLRSRAQQSSRVAGGEAGARTSATIGAEAGQLDNIRAIAEAKRDPLRPGASGQGRLSAAAVERVAAADQGVRLANKLDLLLPQFANQIGPLGGRKLQLQMVMPGAPVPEQLAGFMAEIATLKNATIKAITGAQMSQPEATRIMEQVPDVTNKPEVFKARIKATIDNLTFMRQRTIELSGGQAADLQDALDLSGIGLDADTLRNQLR
jgi:hypothetical protein